MLNDISGIELRGGSFESLTDLKILEPRDGNKIKCVKGAIVYGRNGAGKSTVAKALKKVISGGYSHITEANVFDKDGNTLTLSENEKNMYLYLMKNLLMRMLNFKIQD